MATVRDLLERFADGRNGPMLHEVIADFERRDWAGADGDDSSDWIDNTPGIGPQARQLLHNARRRALAR